MRVSFILALNFIVLASSTSVLARAAAPAVKPLAFSRGGGYLVLVPVTVGDVRATFLLDTGANRSAISERLAARLGLTVTARTSVVSPSGTVAGVAVELAHFTFGPQERRGLSVVVLADAQFQTIARDVDGIVGQDVLMDANYTVDYRRGRITWDELGDGGSDRVQRLALHEDEGRWLVALPQGKSAANPLWLVPDSGASGFVVFTRGGMTDVLLTPLTRAGLIDTVSGGGRARGALMTLRVGDALFHETPTMVIDRAADAPRGDGLLPLSAFASVTFNARGGYLTVREW